MIDPDRFWRLLPQFHQRRDVEAGGPLRALLEVFAEQAALIDADIQRQYDNWFIETCEDWVVPYIGDVIGYTAVHDTGDPSGALKREGQAFSRVTAPRREVANTIRYRRTKGTLALLEQIATDVAGWPSLAVEFRHLVATTIHSRFPQPDAAGTAHIRAAAAGAPGGPADSVHRVAEVRRASSERRAGRYAPHQVGLFVARHAAVPLTRVDAVCAESAGSHCFLFSQLGLDIPLYQPGDRGARILPGPLTRAALTATRDERRATGVFANATYYGEGRSLMVWKQPAAGKDLIPVALPDIVPADLRRWAHRPAPGKVVIDPERGRLMFAEREPPERVVVSYHEGGMGDLGASTRPRRMSRHAPHHNLRLPVSVGAEGEAQDSLAGAIRNWREESPAADGVRSGLIEILDSGIYNEKRLTLDLAPRETLEIRAAACQRPVLRVADYEAARDDAWQISLGLGSTLILDGLLVAGRRLHLRGEGGTLLLRRCTLVPDPRSEAPGRSAAPSLVMDNTTTQLRVQHSILGPIHVRDDELAHEPAAVEITDSVVDGGGGEAIAGPGSIAAHMALTIRRSTLLGRCTVHEVWLAEDCLFTRRLLVARRQRGCVRFCYLLPQSRTPHRFECIPSGRPDAGDADLAPVFVSQRYGHPGYCQLADDCPAAIRRGATDQSELGVFHTLFLPQREANLRARFAEYVPAAVEAGLIYVT